MIVFSNLLHQIMLPLQVPISIQLTEMYEWTKTGNDVQRLEIKHFIFKLIVCVFMVLIKRKIFLNSSD